MGQTGKLACIRSFSPYASTGQNICTTFSLHYSQKANKLLYYLEYMTVRTNACKNSISLLFSSAFTSGHLLRCESLEPSHAHIDGT